MKMFDLRRYHVTNQEEAIEFLTFVESRMGEVKKLIKKQQLTNASLQNNLRIQREQGAKTVTVKRTVDPSASVLQRISGETTETDVEASRLEQLRDASAADTPVNEPGEINTLKEVEPQEVKEDEPFTSEDVEKADVTLVESEPQTIQHKAEEGSGDSADQPETENPAPGTGQSYTVSKSPSKEDITGVGDLVAQKTKGKLPTDKED